VPYDLRLGAVVPEGVAPDRIVWITRNPIEPTEREEEPIPLAAEQAGNIFGGDQRKPERFHHPIEYPRLGRA
jgi:hypothetical protein